MTATEDLLVQFADEQLDLGRSPDRDRTFADSGVSSGDAVSFLIGQTILASLLVAALLFAACGNGGGGPTTTPAPPRASAPAPAPAPAPPQDWSEHYRVARQSAETVWEYAFPAAWNLYYSKIGTFRGYNSTMSSPCGTLGPWNAFYCPVNSGVYYHRGLLDQFSNQYGPLGAAFIIAHEIGHHVSWLLGWDHGVNISVKQSELQADCFAGTWASAVNAVDFEFSSAHLDSTARAVIRTGQPEYTWFDPNNHGTVTQRLTAWEAGFLHGPFICDNPAWLGQFPLS